MGRDPLKFPLNLVTDLGSLARALGRDSDSELTKLPTTMQSITLPNTWRNTILENQEHLPLIT